MKLGKTWILILLVSGLFFTSCEDETEPLDISSLELDYFPLEVGKFIEYQVDSVIYNFQSNSIDTFSSIIREDIVERFLGTDEDTVYRIERRFKRDPGDDWTILDEWAASLSLTQATRTEENLRFIKLIFPPDVGTRWDGNIHIPDNLQINVGGELLEVYKNWDYRIEDKNTEEQIGNFTFDEVLLIQQADDENALERRFSTEKFAKGIGLVYRKMMILDTQCIGPCEGLTWEEKAQKGFILTQTILNHN